ncbi:MAG TPA: hypothetical protein ENN41_05720 [Sediminispirochaeta sp.]|nr:hypothetical protein [Sediminispirochaeta sp.]
MTKMEKLKLYAGRLGLFLAGGLLVFAVMSFTVVNTAKEQNERLSQTLDASRYEAGRLLSDAKAQYESGNYIEAKESLNTLFANQPGSEEAVEGKTLMESVESAENRSNAKWQAAMPGIKREWGEALAEELRADLEANMDDTIDKEWNKVKAQIREEWEKES